MRRRLITLMTAAALTAIAAGSPLRALAAGRSSAEPATVSLTHDAFSRLDLAHPTGAPAPADRMSIGISIAGRDDAGRAALARAVTDPKNARYRRTLTPQQIADRFGARPEQVSAVRHWLQDNGLTVRHQSLDGTLVTATGRVADVESAFQVTEKIFGSGTSAFTANLEAPKVPSGLGITHVAGLQTVNRAHTRAFPVPSSPSAEHLWDIYDMPAVNKGEGQKLATFGWGSGDGVARDLLAFERAHTFPTMPLAIVQDDPTSTDTSGLIEWDLDTQASSGMAPNALGITAYFAISGVSSDLAASLDRWASDPAGARQGSASYGGCEVLDGPVFGDIDQYDTVLQKAVLGGRTLFVSAGDSGSGCTVGPLGALNGVAYGPIPSQEYPATSPWGVAVGGSVLSTKTDQAGRTVRDVEYAWDHTGGGPSYVETAPSYQQAVAATPCLSDTNGGVVSANAGLACRAVPDIATWSGNLVSGYETYVGGPTYGDANGGPAPNGVAGTSLSAPLLQGMWARISAASATGSTGFADPLLYSIGAGPANAVAFYDVTIGNNGAYTATPGWDYVSGLGAPDVTALMKLVDGGNLAPTDPTGSYGGTSVGTPPPPPPPPPACPSGQPLISDPAGDATVDAAPVSIDTLDIVSGDLVWNAATSTLTAATTVKALSLDPPPASIGKHFEFGFAVGGKSYLLTATSDKVYQDLNSPIDPANPTPPSTPTTDHVAFTLARPGGSGSFATDLATVSGSFDVATNTVRVDLPAATMASFDATFGPGSVLTGFTAESQIDDVALRDDGDTAAGGSCSFTIPAPATTHGKGHVGHGKPPAHAANVGGATSANPAALVPSAVGAQATAPPASVGGGLIVTLTSR